MENTLMYVPQTLALLLVVVILDCLYAIRSRED